VEVRNEAREGAEQGRLAGPGTTQYQRDLSRCQTRRHVPKSRRGRARVGVRQAFCAR
jgi:hypothetical protein